MVRLTHGIRALLAFGVLGVGLAGAALVYPAAAAVVCSSCYGFDLVRSGVYVEHGVPASASLAVEGVVSEARQRVRGFYGTLLSDPKILICATEACYHRVGGGRSRGMAVLDQALFLSPRGTTPIIASHELAHIELHHRLGLFRTLRRAIPQWFDEGLAVTISDDPRYLAPSTQADRCLIRSDEPLPSDRQAWIETAASRDLYAKAACRVSRWLDTHGRANGIKQMVKDLEDGRSFAQASR